MSHCALSMRRRPMCEARRRSLASWLHRPPPPDPAGAAPGSGRQRRGSSVPGTGALGRSTCRLSFFGGWGLFVGEGWGAELWLDSLDPRYLVEAGVVADDLTQSPTLHEDCVIGIRE